MATGRGGAGEVPPVPAQSRPRNEEPRPGPDMLIGGKSFPVPVPVGSPKSVGDRGKQRANKKSHQNHHNEYLTSQANKQKFIRLLQIYNIAQIR